MDLFSEEEVNRTEAAVGNINPSLKIIRTTHASADVDLFAAAQQRDLHGVYDKCELTRITSG